MSNFWRKYLYKIFIRYIDDGHYKNMKFEKEKKNISLPWNFLIFITSAT
jgi:hypothetical protein